VRLTQINMEGQNNQANTRLSAPRSADRAVAAEGPDRHRRLDPRRPGRGLGAALLMEAIDRRVRRPEDLLVSAGVPVIGVLRPAGSSRPVFRQLLMVNNGPPHRPALAALPGARS
jgi:hypothetical protein